MARDQNTVAKRQREADKKRKAAEKRERRAKKKQEKLEGDQAESSQSALSSGERAVLDVFRKYLMTPGKMLCFGTSDQDTLEEPLAQLTRKGLLVSERFQGGYSLTEPGFAAMKGSK